MVEHTSKAFLGQTLNGTRCHAHKFNPFSQTETYQLCAAFEPHGARMDPIPGQPGHELRKPEAPDRNRWEMDHGTPIAAILA